MRPPSSTLIRNAPVDRGTSTALASATTCNPAPNPPFRNWKLTLSYDGTDYSGWQVQPGQPTIQGELQAALGRVTGESPLPQGSGRTDAGVHALAQVASFPLRAPHSRRKPAARSEPHPARRDPRPRGQDRVRADSTPAIRPSPRPTSTVSFSNGRQPSRPERRVSPNSALATSIPIPGRCDFKALQESARAFLGTHDF